MSEISFTIPFECVPKQSQKSFIRNGKFMPYQPKKITSNASVLAMFANQHRPSEPFEGPIMVRLTFYTPWLKKHKQKIREDGRHPKCTRPDVDNLTKQLLDSLKGCGFFKDDAQVQELNVSKWFGPAHQVSVVIGRVAI